MQYILQTAFIFFLYVLAWKSWNNHMPGGFHSRFLLLMTSGLPQGIPYNTISMCWILLFWHKNPGQRVTVNTTEIPIITELLGIKGQPNTYHIVIIDIRLCKQWQGIWTLALTHWGRVTQICVGNLTIIGSDNGSTPGRRQANIRTNVGILLIGSLGTDFSDILFICIYLEDMHKHMPYIHQIIAIKMLMRDNVGSKVLLCYLVAIISSCLSYREPTFQGNVGLLVFSLYTVNLQHDSHNMLRSYLEISNLGPFGYHKKSFHDLG